tara:strand:+ start:8523 stop:10028 length:1506 start_codon:yes stop_codon:yes gene_type:complete
MSCLKKINLCLVLLVSTFAIAQSNNVFLERSFWKTNPTVPTVEQKIKEGNDSTQLNSYGFDGVTYAILEDAPLTTLKHMLTKEGNGVNKLTHDGRTYIFWAAYKNNIDLVKHLLQEGARTDIRDDHSNTIALFAAGAGNTNAELYDILAQHGADLSNETTKNGANILLLAAPHVKDLSELDYFVSEGMSLQSTDTAGSGIFNYVAKTGNTKLLDALIEKGVAYKELNKEKGNAMLFASQGTRGTTNGLKVYQYLESKGITPNVTTTEGVTPLHTLAYRSDDKAVLNYFIKKGVDVNQANEEGNNSFMNAASANTLDIVKLLEEKVADINHTNKKGQSALSLAVANNSAEVVAYLLKNGADASVTDTNGNTLAYYVMDGYSTKEATDFNKKLTLLKQNDVSLTTLQEKDNSLYHLAVAKNNIDLLKLVVKMADKKQLQHKNADGLTPLHLAAMNAKNDTILKYLLSLGADKNVVTDFEETAYDLASENEQLESNNIDLNFLK